MMKRIIAPLACLLIAACDKVPINGALDGMWQLTSIETPAGRRDTKADRAFLSFELHLSQWVQGGYAYYAHFTHTGDSIVFSDFAHASLHRTQADDDERITAAEMNEGILDAWGVHTLDARYRVRTLTGSSLVLEQADTVLCLRKF